MFKFYVLPSATKRAEFDCWQVAVDGSVSEQKLSAEGVKALTKEIVLVVPPEHITWHAADIPQGLKARGDSRLLPVLNGIVEDALLDDDVHIFLPHNFKGGTLNLLGICNKRYLVDMLQSFDAIGVAVSRIAPLINPESLSEGDAICTGTEGQGWLSVLDNDVPVTLPLVDDAAILSCATQVQAYPAVFREAENAYPKVAVSLLTIKDSIANIEHSFWDLAQHDLASNRSIRFKRKSASIFRDVLHQSIMVQR